MEGSDGRKKWFVDRNILIIFLMLLGLLIFFLFHRTQQWQPCTQDQAKVLKSTYDIRFDDYTNSFTCKVKT